VLAAHGLEGKIPLAGLAKGNEELYLPGRPDPLVLPRKSEGLYLVQRIRDEAHRFALGQQRTQHRRLSLASQLEAIDGIGPVRRKALLRAYGDLERIRAADVEALAAVPGMTREAAERVKAGL